MKESDIFNAIDEEKIDVLSDYLQSGGNPDVLNMSRETPLFYILDNFSPVPLKLFNLFIKHGSNVNFKKTPKAFSLLHIAVSLFNFESVKILLENNAYVNESTNKYHWAPLHLPSTGEITEILIAYGAFVNARDKKGLTPLQLTINNPSGPYNKKVIFERAKKLIASDARLNLYYEDEKSLVDQAIMCDLPEVAKLLIENDAPSNNQASDGFSTLSYAIVMGAEELVEPILLRGANPNAKTKGDGWTPFFHAVQSSNKKIIQLLLKYGADKNIKDNYGKYPKDYTNDKNILELVS